MHSGSYNGCVRSNIGRHRTFEQNCKKRIPKETGAFNSSRAGHISGLFGAVCGRKSGSAVCNADIFPNHLRVQDPGNVEGNPVFIYLDAFCREEQFERYLPEYANLDELKDHYKRGGLGDVKVKKFLNNVLQEELEPIRNRRKELQKDIPYVYEVLKKGSEAAREVAAKTLDEVRASMKINYFEDQALIQSQAEKYAE